MHLNELTAIRLYHISEQNRVMAIRGSGNTTIETEEDIFEGNLYIQGVILANGLNTHFVVQDRGTGFVRTWSGSYGTGVNSFQVHYDGTMYVAGDGTALSGPNETYVRIYADGGGDKANFLVNTSSLGINHNDVTAMALDNSESIFVGNRRILKYLSGSYTTPIWTSSLHTHHLLIFRS